MTNLQELMLDVLQHGDVMENRTGTNTISVVSRDVRWSMKDGFNAVTTKKLAFKAVIGELLWFLSGSDDINDLRYLTGLSQDDFCIWQKNLDQYNERLWQAYIAINPEQANNKAFRKSMMNQSSLGFIYSKTWREYPVYDVNSPHKVVYHDQVQQLLDDILAVKADPTKSAARRLLVEAWHPKHTDESGLECALPPCHYGYQCFVRNGKLSLKWIQRSVDVFLGLPFNIASYNALAEILAKLAGLETDELIFSGGDVHIYEDHREQVLEQCSRVAYSKPKLILPDIKSLDQFTNMEFTADDFKLEGYEHHSALKGNMS